MAADYIIYPHLFCFSYHLKSQENTTWSKWYENNQKFQSLAKPEQSYYEFNGKDWEAIYEQFDFGDTESLLLFASCLEKHKKQSLNFIKTLKSNFDSIQGNIGKTWLVLGEVEPGEEVAIAQTIASFWNIKAYSLSESELFVGNQLFSYQINANEQLLILLAPNSSSMASFADFYYELNRLFYYYHKIKWSHQQNQIIKKHLQNENFFPLTSEIPTIQLAVADFDILHANFYQLKESLYENILKLDRHTRGIEGLSLQLETLKTNLSAYKSRLNRLQSLTQENKDNRKTDLKLWSNFAENTAQTYQDQIQQDILSLRPGLKVREQHISTLRGIVEASQAERDRNIENLVGAAGLGVGLSSAAAGAWADKTEPWTTFGISVGWGFGSFAVLYVLLWFFRGNKGKK
ncbi:MAG: hypothetical protein ACLFV6_16510 [Spirulinaceae cyanobacterium]